MLACLNGLLKVQPEFSEESVRMYVHDSLHSVWQNFAKKNLEKLQSWDLQRKVVQVLTQNTNAQQYLFIFNRKEMWKPGILLFPDFVSVCRTKLKAFKGH